MLTKFARMNICKRCCLKGFGKWLRESDENVEWTTNPFDAEKVLEMGDIEIMAHNEKEKGMTKIEEKEEKNDKNISDKYARSIMENSALRAEMKRKDEEIKRKDEENKRLTLLLEVQSASKKINLKK
eukprot:g11659.t1